MAQWLLPVVSAAVALYLLYKGFSDLKKARTIEDVPTSRIRSAHQGYIELTGVTRAYDDLLLQAPLTGTSCVWFDYTIERYEGGRNSRWAIVERGASDQTFVLFDGTGECLVDPRHSDVLTSHKKRWSGYLRHPARPQEISLLGRLRRQRYRYTERRIHRDQPLYAIGWFQTLHATSAEKQRDDYAVKLLSQWKQDYENLLERFDADRNGEIDLQEWQRARVAAAEQARQFIDGNYDASDVNLMFKPTNGQAFLLSTSDPEEIAKHYRRSTLAKLAAGAVLAGFTLWTTLGGF